MTPKTLEQLIETAFPGTALISHTELETNKGYNNRVYFLKVRRIGESSIFRDTDATERELVLKVNGRFFGAAKVQNEVGCIQILRQYCPDVPVPTVIAWSEEGADVTLSNPASQEKKRVDLSIDADAKKHGGWILMLRLPGKPLSTCDFDDNTRLGIMKQLASVTASWRTKVPAQKYIGNIQFHKDVHHAEPDFVINENSGPERQNLVVRGILVDELFITTPIVSTTQQYTLKMERKLKDLETSDNYVTNRHLAPLIKNFVQEKLPQLNIAVSPSHNASGSFVFTHYDFAPRNILLEGSPPKISGIVDFEFAGFFSPVEDFLNDAVGNEGDWPQSHYSAYLQELESKGIATPERGISKAIWDRVHYLERVADNIAPWWLPGPYTGPELETHFAKAAEKMQENLAKLD